MKDIHESLPILAIVIGVSSYFQKDIVALPAAQVDAVNFHARLEIGEFQRIIFIFF
jgi:hypothetical protein